MELRQRMNQLEALVESMITYNRTKNSYNENEDILYVLVKVLREMEKIIEQDENKRS